MRAGHVQITLDFEVPEEIAHRIIGVEAFDEDGQGEIGFRSASHLLGVTPCREVQWRVSS